MKDFNGKDLEDSNIKVLGDHSTLVQVINLLALIRHAVSNNIDTEIKIKICKTTANNTFLFDVNGMLIPDVKTTSEVTIC